jgi:hypothetical protein
MLPSQQKMVEHLSKLQRDFLIDHHNGLRPFWRTPTEMRTCESLIERELIRYEPEPPPGKERLVGKSDGTMLTDPFGREAFGLVISWYIEELVRINEKREALKALFNKDRQLALRYVLMESIEYWRKEEPRDNVNHTNKKMLL